MSPVSDLLGAESSSAESELSCSPVRPESPETMYLGLPVRHLAPEPSVMKTAERQHGDVSFLSKIHAKTLVAELRRGARNIANVLFHDRKSFAKSMGSLCEDEEGVFNLFENLLSAKSPGQSPPVTSLPLTEIATQLALLAQGSESEKVEAIFSLVDSDGDGSLSLDELCAFFQLVLGTVLATRTLISPAQLATQTAAECMSMCDLNGDGRLSLDEFQRWFASPKLAPVYSPFMQPAKAPRTTSAADPL